MPSVTGTVKELGTAVSGRTVRVYRRDTGALLGVTYSSIGGGGPFGFVDPYVANVSSLLHFEGVDASTTFVDETGKTWTASGPTISTTSPLRGSSSGSFPSGTGVLMTPTSSDFDVGSGDFTIELLINSSSVAASQQVFGKYGNTGATSSGLGIYLTAGGSTGFFASANGTSWGLANDLKFGTLSASTTYHLAVTRSGTTFRTFLNGTLANSTTASGAVWNGDNPRISVGSTSAPGTTAMFNGKIDEFRFTKGIARYTASFVPPSGPHPNPSVVSGGSLGDYSFTDAYTGEVQVVVLDDAAGTTYNDLIERATPA